MFAVAWHQENPLEPLLYEWDGEEDELTPDPNHEVLHLWDGEPHDDKPWKVIADNRVYTSKTDAMHDILDYLQVMSAAYRRQMIKIYAEIEKETNRLTPVKRG